MISLGIVYGVGGVTSLLLLGYLVYALIFAERF
jgi:K+-transporting ATPase KdpF subunit